MAVAAAHAGSKKARRSEADQRVEKTTFIETKSVGSQSLNLYARGGAVGVGQLADRGEVLFVPLDRIRTHRNADGNGRYRWYNDYRLPSESGGGVVTVRLHGNDEDVKRRLDRPENVRAI